MLAISDYFAGIWLKNCHNAFIKGSENDDITNDSEVLSTGPEYFRGIDIESSTNCRINCNHILNIPHSIYFTDDCSLTKLRKNVFENYIEGVELLDDQTLLPTQGEDPGSGFLPYDNVWKPGSVENNRVFKKQINTPNPIFWYYDDNSDPQLIPIPSNTINAIGLINTDCQCNCSTNTRISDRDISLGKIIGDSIIFSSHPSEFSYQAKMNVFLAMKEDSTLIYQGMANDSLYINFFNQMNNTNMARLDSVVILSVQNLTDDAIALNDDILDTNYVEYCRKLVQSIYLNGPAQENEISSSDSSDLITIAYLPTSLAGVAVYSAAAMLELEIHPQVEEESRIGNSTYVENAQKVMNSTLLVYPNPSNDKIYFDCKSFDLNRKSEICIYDNMGKLILKRNIGSDLFIFDAAKVKSGLYRFEIKDDLVSKFKGSFTVVQ